MAHKIKITCTKEQKEEIHKLICLGMFTAKHYNYVFGTKEELSLHLDELMYEIVQEEESIEEARKRIKAYLSEQGRIAKMNQGEETQIFRNGKPLQGKRLEMARQAFKDYFEFEDDEVK